MSEDASGRDPASAQAWTSRRNGVPRAGYRLRHREQLGRVLERLFVSMNVLHETFDVPPAFNEAMTALLVSALGLPD
jgi:hypothetical protein